MMDGQKKKDAECHYFDKQYLASDVVNAMEDMFARLDESKSGKLTPSNFLSAGGHYRAWAETVGLEKFDGNKDGLIDPEEFHQAFIDQAELKYYHTGTLRIHFNHMNIER